MKQKIDINEINTWFSILKEVDETDAAQITRIRNSREDSYLTRITSDPSDQAKYLASYRERRKSDDERYYKIFDKSKSIDPMGLVRITAMSTPLKFSWESFITVPEAHSTLALDVMLTIYAIGFITLNKSVCGPWKIPRAGEKILRFHISVGMAKKIDEDDESHIMLVDKKDFLEKYPFYRKQKFATSDNPLILGF
jgi:hypothetical protein